MKLRSKFPRAFQLATLSIAIALTGASGLSTATAAEPAQTKKPAIPDVLQLKVEHGPWLILAMSFDGPNAKSQAEQLAVEMRRDFKLPTYCMKKQFDFTQSIQGAGFDEQGNERRMKFRDRKVIDGYAVLVGDFDSIDSEAITDTLNKVKHITPKMLAAQGSEDASKMNTVPVNTYRNYLRNFVVKKKEEETKLGPMFGAFVTRNPLLPADFYKAPELDKFVKSLNEQKEYSEYSLLDCSKKYTVRVAVFAGEDQVKSWGRSSQEAESGTSQLELAGERAALTVKALRRAGYEAYQFHDRTQSYVTVGSFNELGATDKANRFVYDPAIQAIITRFGGTSQVTRSQYGTTPTPRLLFDLVDQKTIPELNQGDTKSKIQWFSKYSVAFDIKPAPMAVPRMTGSGIYGGSLLGKDRR